MVEVSNKHKSITVGVSSNNGNTIVTAKSDTAQYWANQSHTFADQAKESVQEAKNYAELANSYIEGFEDVVTNNTNNIITTSNDCINQLTELKDASAVEINEAVASGKDEINSTKTTILNDIEFVADGEKQEIEELADLIKENAEEIANRTSFAMFDTVLKDHVLTYKESKGLALQGTYVYKEAIAGSRYGYPDFYAKCLEEFNEATATETVNGVEVKVHTNGHKFYDIANKDAIDDFFNTMGTAWMYGIDTENERIFLPRNNWFEQLTVDVDGVGDSVQAGLPQIPDHRHAYYYSETQNGSGAAEFGENRYGPVETMGISYIAPSNIYGKSNTVQPNAVKKLLYICVGNTENQSTITDVVDVTTTENDTLPLGYHFYQDGAQPSLSYMKSEGQYNSGKTYETFYNEFVQKIGQAFAGGFVREITDEYTEYDLVINQDDMTFRLPLLDGSEDLPSDRYVDLTLNASGSSYIAPANGWYYLNKSSTAGNQYIGAIKENGQQYHVHSVDKEQKRINVPVKKGEVITIEYNATGATKYFRFIYAQGNGSLYFKVANAVTNLELLNAGEVMEAVNNVIPNNSCLIASYAMPSSKYVYLTLGASGTTYTAPANGRFVFYFEKFSSDTAQCWFKLYGSNQNVVSIDYPSTSNWVHAGNGINVKKDDTVTLEYGGNYTTAYFKFIYAEGEQ